MTDFRAALLPMILTASILLVATIWFGSSHTWPFGFWNLAFNLIWKRYYAIAKYWPETEEPSQSPKSSRISSRSIESWPWSAAVARWILPLSLAFDGMLNLFKIFYAPGLSFFNPYDTYLQSLGAIVLVVSIVILTWADSFLARYVYGTPPNQRAILNLGPYRHIRHPVYLSFILFGLGALLVSLSYLMLIPFAYLLLIAYVYRFEDERDLVRKYGKDYLEYMGTTGGFLPKFIKR